MRFTFEEKKVAMETYELPDEELIEEESKPVKERILASLQLEPATNTELQKLTGASAGTIRNNLSELIGADLITATEGRPKTYQLVSSSLTTPRDVSGDDTSKATVAGLFANPPDWLPKQLEVYRKDPKRHLGPLCAAVAAVVLGDGARANGVREEVERELACS